MADILITVRGEAETRTAPELATIAAAAVADGPHRSEVVERAAATAAPVRDELARRAAAGHVSTWSSGSASIWSDRPWHPDGRQLDPVHHAVIEFTATFGDLAALSEWASEIADDDGIRISRVEWHLSPATRARIEREVATTAVDVAVARATAYAGALGRTTVDPAEIADVGLLSGAGSPSAAEPRFARLAASSMDAGGPTLDLRPADIVVTSAVEGRFIAR